jgi:gamma-glutamyltranspeptidase/glutathione hydrolase
MHTLFRPRIVRPVVTIALLAVLAARGSADVVVQAERAVVISGHPEATRLGMDVLRDGGNAIDALVTVSLALGVAEPGNSGPGGKMGLLYYDAKTKAVSAVVALPTAPKGIDVQKAIGLTPAAKKRGWSSVCTPGLVAGLGAAHERWGTKPWAALVRPAAQLAEDGFKLNALAAEMLAEYPKEVDATAAAIYAPGGRHPREGDVVRNPDMAVTLRLIADGGAKAFYTGPIAEKLVAAARAGGNPLTLEDLASYAPRFLQPLSTDYRGYAVYSSPPPFNGGATLLLAMECLERMPMAGARPRDAGYMDTVGRVMQQVYPAVSRAAGDVPDSMANVGALLQEASVHRLVERAKAAMPGRPHPDDAQSRAGFEWTLDDGDQACTTHLIIVDAQGNVACATQSLGYHFGAAVVAPGTGFLVNNDMNNFAYLTRASVNFIAPGKMPRSTMTPTIVLKDGRPVLAIGSPAGQRIPGNVLQCVVDVLDFKRPLEETIEAPRFYVRRPTSSTQPANEMDLEKEAPAELDAELAAKGWKTFRRSRGEFYFGAVNAVDFLPGGRMIGVADPRRTGDAGAE